MSNLSLLLFLSRFQAVCVFAYTLSVSVCVGVHVYASRSVL